MTPWAASLGAIVTREVLKFLRNRSRFLASLVRPLVWLLIFAAGFRSILGVSIIPPYQTYVTYEVYILPGLCAMVQLFNGMQSSLGLVLDRETGALKLLLTSPLPRPWLLLCRLLAAAVVSLVQVAVLLAVALVYGIRLPLEAAVVAVPVLFLTGFMCAALGLALSAVVRQIENFAGVMNFVIFPMFFLSSALYPLWKLRESSTLLGQIAGANPFTHAVEAVRFALYGQVAGPELGWVALASVVFAVIGVIGYDPARAIVRRRF